MAARAARRWTPGRRGACVHASCTGAPPCSGLPRGRGPAPATSWTMSGLFDLAMPWWAFVLRTVAVYFILLAMLRLSGKRTVGQFTPFDLLVIVLLGTAVQNSLIGEDYSLLGGLLLAATLIACNWLVGFATARSRRL